MRETGEMEDKKIEDVVLDVSVMNAKLKQIANEDLGLTQEYNKNNRDKLWEGNYGTKAKRTYKDSSFGFNLDGSEKQTFYDSKTGKTLHKSHNAAKNKYHAKNNEGEKISSEWSKYAAEADHIVALKDAHNVAKHNPFLKDSDFKEIMNSEENLRILAKSENTSKGEKSDLAVAFDTKNALTAEGRVQLVKENREAVFALQGKFAVRTVQNVGNEFIVGAQDTLVKSAVPLIRESVKQIIDVAQGEKEFKDAAKEIGKTTMDVAVAGGTNRLLLDTASSVLSNSKSSVLKNIANSNEVAQIITVANIVQESAVKYINGQIDEREFIEEVGVKGTTMVAGMIGGEIGQEIGRLIGATIGTAIGPGIGTAVGYFAGGAVGEILGTIITTVACSAIMTVYTTSKNLDSYKLTDRQIKVLEKEALDEMERQRNKFREIVQREYKVWDGEIQKGFDQMVSNACKETFDLNGVTEGVDRVLAVFRKTVAFKDLKEYEAQLDMPLKLSF